ncbi:lipoprotein insertase outer membrane protein LolB [Alkalimonas amylolytica]|uniref:Outer-membrane lipoprotein LolB n=1 Tax=Alkalimonas amylolytica TaxID=152573 RepID=A0A1H4DUL6_ALKAM|nr:lipoprotein insertase outer membrane protein LolB [Alkalimonas amylolytica]SEA75902.1 outer membrane lipoprotein LolB [Alkalimonas amylolytica]
MPIAVKSLFTLLLLTLMLSGCSIKPQTDGPILSAKQRLERIEQLQHFELTATMGIRSPADNVSGSLHWQQQGEDYQARMTNFLGIRIFSLASSAGSTRLQVQGEDYQASNSTELMLALTGWSLPLDDMSLWLKGLAGDNASAKEYDALGRLIAFELLDRSGYRWQVRYQRFFPDGLALPRNIEVQSDDFHIKLVIRSWQL